MEVPAALVTVRVYVVVDVGETDTPMPVSTEMLPGVMTAAPSAKTAVSVDDVPAVIDVGKAVKLVIDGGGTTVTVLVCVVAVPAALVTVSV